MSKRANAIRYSVVIIGIAIGSGCSSESKTLPTSGSSVSSSPTSAAATATSVAGSATTLPSASAAAVTSLDPTTVPSTATTVPDGPSALAAAVAGLTTAYHFTGDVSVNGAPALTVDGDHVGEGARFSVTGNGTTVAYVVLPDGTWIQPADGTWSVLADPPASVDPIDALNAPTSVVVTAAANGTTELDVAVPPPLLGLAGDVPVPIHVVITSGALTSVSYQTSVDNISAQVVTTFGPAVDASPVVAPI